MVFSMIILAIGILLAVYPKMGWIVGWGGATGGPASRRFLIMSRTIGIAAVFFGVMFLACGPG